MQNESIAILGGVGAARAKLLADAGLETLEDLANFLPKEYRDLTHATPIAQLRVGESALVRVIVIESARDRRAKGLTVTRCVVSDGSETIPCVWYNQPWMSKQMRSGAEVSLYGKAVREKSRIILQNPSVENRAGIAPVYRTIQGVPGKVLTRLIGEAVARLDGAWADELPLSVRERHALCEKNVAMRGVHFPANWEELKTARRRLAFDELFLYQVALSLMRSQGKKGIVIPADDEAADDFWAHLPFAPTGAQRRVLSEIVRDLSSEHPMARLVQGDVGSGKTAVAFGALYLAVKAGYQGALMAPTEILARQHFESAQAILEPLGIRCGLILGSMGQKAHREAHEAMANGDWQVAIGTHALISQKVEFQNLGLVVVDEQHRFGVRQRSALSDKGDSPNVLVMSATPIPRTLSLILYGDLDVSVIDELPPGRRPVGTRIVPEAKRADMYNFLRSEVREGRQVYVVCPLIEESEAMEARPAEELYEDLRTQALSDLRIALVHGRMKPADKDSVIAQFQAGEVDVLVSTTVIEVGVNVPNASVMVIENADRFGLAQLHQLRGRVGRGSDQAWCFLMAEPNERLRTMTKTNDGFVIAQKDMELRGPGELLGTRQSGAMLDGAMADLALLSETHEAARELLHHPESEETRAAIRLAEKRFRRRMENAGMN